jgi:hypothetical protein
MIKARVENNLILSLLWYFDKILPFDSQKGDTLSSECKFENKSAINSNVDSSSNNLL